MRTAYLLIICLLIFPVFVFADYVSPSKAETVARNFYYSANNQYLEPDFQLINNNTFRIPGYKTSWITTPAFYIFNIKNSKGYIIVAADDCVVPLLGYSFSSNYIENNEPPALQKWLQGLQLQIAQVIDAATVTPDNITQLWTRYLNNNPYNNPIKSSVTPLLSTTWSQSPYYNSLCPGGSVSGCVATAMSQIMKFWNYPEQGSGFHSYNHNNYGTLSANFGAESYDWSQMPNSVTSANTAVATLMYHVGVSVEMNYSPESSGAYVISSNSPVQHCSEYALTTYFGYDAGLQGIARSNYTNAQWMQTIKAELDAHRPVLYAGFGSGGGHAFVCDGYDSYDYLHMNWGWGGYYDGYFPVDALDPSGTGTGGGTGGYNSGHQAIIGIQPPDQGGGSSNTDLDMRLYDQITLSTNPIYYGQTFTIYTDIVNYGPDNFAGDFCAAAFDAQGIFVEFVDILTPYELESGYHYINGVTFESSGSLSLLPGLYYIGIFYKPTNANWIMLDDGNYSNLVSLTVQYSNDIELYGDINISGGATLMQYESVSVSVDIGNYGTTDFNGVVDISLYNLDGSLAETIMTSESTLLEPGFWNTYSFYSSSVNVEPGTYLMACLHKKTDSNWELSGSTYYTNPIKVIVQEPLINEDPYEYNDEINSAYNLNAVFSGNQSHVITSDANSHTGEDVDFYTLNLESGFEYTIQCRAHDSYSSNNGKLYTNDVLWSYNNADSWSDVYDDVMPGNISLENGGRIYFLVAPYFEGETGTYLLDITITRTPTGIDNFTNQFISIYPNPAVDKLFFNLPQLSSSQGHYSITDRTGATLKKQPITNNTRSIDIRNLNSGTYILQLQLGNESYVSKFIKQ